MKLYHATFTKHLPQILKLGLRMKRPPVWTNYLGRSLGGGAIYACVERADAIRWAAKMEWEFRAELGTGGVSIVAIEVEEVQRGYSYPEGWERDRQDPLSQSAHSGPWVCTWHPVPAERIVATERVTSDMIRSITMQAVRGEAVEVEA